MNKIKFPGLRVTLLGVGVIVAAFADGSGESLMTLVAAVLHESGHIALMLFLGIGINGITVTPLGLEITPGRTYRSFNEEIAVNLAGCAMNFITYFVFRGASGILGVLSDTSLLLGIMNILPIRCIDGGEALNAFLNLLFLPDSADRISYRISFATLIFLWIPAVYIFLITGYNYSLFIMCTWLFCRIFF